LRRTPRIAEIYPRTSIDPDDLKNSAGSEIPKFLRKSPSSAPEAPVFGATLGVPDCRFVMLAS
jgi:hypothetical protein